jgi:hypothetical protein
MGDRRIFLKSLHDTFFNKDLFDEPNFGRIHLAGQYHLLAVSFSQIINEDICFPCDLFYLFYGIMYEKMQEAQR